jgi:SpoVK/Ycf46/Vps4 family AAA+-type ATPase
VEERPTQGFDDVGGLEKQMEELMEAVVLPITHKEKFDAVGAWGCLVLIVFMLTPLVRGAVLSSLSSC